MNLDICRKCPRRSCFLCFSFGGIHPFMMLLGQMDFSKIKVEAWEGDKIRYDMAISHDFILHKTERGDVEIVKYLENWNSFREWDYYKDTDLPLYASNAVVDDEKWCVCFVEQMVDYWNAHSHENKGE